MVKKPLLHLIRLHGMPVFEQLQLEEALLRTDDRNFCLMNTGSPPAIVLGVSGKAHEHICEEHYASNPMAVIRRFSGGGTVVVDEGTLFVSLICNRRDIPEPAFPQQILQWNGELYRPFLGHMGFAVLDNDYAIGDKKFGGNAQYLSKHRWLHHTTHLWDFKEEHMRCLKMPPKMPLYRQGREHSDFLCRLKHYLPSKEAFFSAFEISLAKHFDIAKTSPQSVKAALQLPHRKATESLTNC